MCPQVLALAAIYPSSLPLWQASVVSTAVLEGLAAAVRWVDASTATVDEASRQAALVELASQATTAGTAGGGTPVLEGETAESLIAACAAVAAEAAAPAWLAACVLQLHGGMLRAGQQPSAEANCTALAAALRALAVQVATIVLTSNAEGYVSAGVDQLACWLA